MNLFKETKKLFSKNPKITLKLLCFSNKLIMGVTHNVHDIKAFLIDHFQCKFWVFY
jgi:hypothetical protein